MINFVFDFIKEIFSIEKKNIAVSIIKFFIKIRIFELGKIFLIVK